MAANYARAKFHSSDERLREVLDLALPRPGDLALDVATGAGHVALALAPHVRRVYGLDLTPQMLAQAGRLVIYRKGKPADPSDFRGVYRLGLPRQD